MKTNALPEFDRSDRSTGCCYRFNPVGWDGRHLHFEKKPFMRVETKSVLHIPVNMGSVFAEALGAIERLEGFDGGENVVLSHELSPWKAEHFFAVNTDVPNHNMVGLSGEYMTKVFEGPFKDAKQWHDQICADIEANGHKVGEVYFYYTTCPKCAKAYGKNYVVGFAKLAAEAG